MAAAVVRSTARDERVVDTRTPSPAPSQASANGNDAYKPDLSKEVSLLSTKLINAINYQTNLDDSLQATRIELEQAQAELKKLRAEKQSLDDAVTEGVLMKKSEVDATIAQLKAELAQEREKREAAERVKRQTESEVENLTGSLFEEANKMVSEARKDAEAAERRSSQLRGQLSDTELLLFSQQEQLQDLKTTMEALERSATNATAIAAAQRDSSTPSTPVNANSGAFEALQLSPPADAPSVEPNHPLHFSHLLQPVLRTDITSFLEFSELLAAAKKAAPHSRNASGNMSNSASSTNLSSTSTNATSAAATSSPNLPGSFNFSNSNSPSSSAMAYTAAPALKDTKFYKRILLEDLEPTLRLDLAPGLSFLSRRSVFSALLNGTLFVEPFAPSSHWKLYAPIFPCALCNESRKNEPYIRRHRFRTSESEDAQRYPLCDYCLNRVRASGDFVSFLRMVRDGVWRCEGEDGERLAWEEAVRLRERMFWARLAGGVVPAVSAAGWTSKSSPVKARTSLEDIPEQRSRAHTGADGDAPRQSEDVFRDRAGSEATTGSIIDEPEVQEAQVQELKRRTMLHMSENPAIAALAQQDDDTSDDNTQTSSQAEQAQSSAQLQQEDADATTSLPPTPSTEDEGMVSAEEDPSTPPPVPEHRSLPPSPEKGIARLVGSDSKERRGSESSTVRTRPSVDERRPSSSSSVLARVRAMEAKSSKG